MAQDCTERHRNDSQDEKAGSSAAHPNLAALSEAARSRLGFFFGRFRIHLTVNRRLCSCPRCCSQQRNSCVSRL